MKKVKVKSGRRSVPALVLPPKSGANNAAGILWIRGGGKVFARV